jgi:hypothetical protein
MLFQVASSLLTERNRLFGRHSQTGKKKKKTSKLTGWTGQFFCLASSTTERIPNVSEKEVLITAGLGLKKIRLENDDDESEVMKKLMSSGAGFPQLAEAGGFELLRSEQNCRILKVIGSRWNSKELKMYVGGQAKIYIRPVQNNLSTQPMTLPPIEEDYKTMCDICSSSIPVRQMREHMQECVDLPDLSGSIVFTYPNTSPVNSQVTHSETYGTENILVTGSVPAGESSEMTGRTFPNTSPVNSEVTHSELNDIDNTLMTGSVPAVESTEMTVSGVVDSVVNFCVSHNITNPVEILKKLQKDMVTGRPLEIEDVTQCLDGATNFILVDRSRPLDTAFDELSSLTPSELRLTLEVQFYDEVCIFMPLNTASKHTCDLLIWTVRRIVKFCHGSISFQQIEAYASASKHEQCSNFHYCS